MGLTSDRLGTAAALLGKQLSKAVSTVGLVLPGRELLASQHLVTVVAGEAVTVPRRGLVCDPTLVDHLIHKARPPSTTRIPRHQ